MLSSKLKDTCTWLHSANKSVACAAVSSRSIKQELALPAAGHYYRMACSLLHFTKGRTARDRLTESRYRSLQEQAIPVCLFEQSPRLCQLLHVMPWSSRWWPLFCPMRPAKQDFAALSPTLCDVQAGLYMYM
ncbi:hypothetical protein ABBQ32_006343 [Trebouxia sp. C0010 RCD-2024]